MRILMKRIRNRKIPHALLFTGIDGIGRYQSAVRLAMILNCSERTTIRIDSFDQNSFDDKDNASHFPACGACPSCKKIISGSHPDILHIKPAGSAIKIDQIRSLRNTLSLKPYEARHRMAILDKAQEMTIPAFNALLKILEEPPERTTMILIANKPSDLLPTIVSRCQQIRFAPVPNEQIAHSLAKRHGVDKKCAQIAATMAGGSFDVAKEMASNQWQRQRDWMFNEMTLLSQNESTHGKGSIRRTMALAEMLAKNLQMLDNVMVLIKSWLRDSAIWPFMPEDIINQDMAVQIGKQASAVSAKTFFTSFSALENMEKQIQANANTRLALETYLIKLTHTLPTSGGLE